MLRTGTKLSGLEASFYDAVTQWLVPWVAYYGLEGTVVSGYRSAAEQDSLYRLGRSAYQYASHTKLHGAQGSVTDAPAGQSAHNYGLAIDVEGPDQASIVEIGRQLGFGTVSWDPAHLEHPRWRAIAGVQSS